MKAVIMTFTDNIIKQCPYCGYKASVKKFGIWEEDGKRGLLGKTPEGFIMFLCPNCEKHIKYDPLSNEFLTQAHSQKTGFFKYLMYVISPRKRHWGQTHDSVVGNLWNKLEGLEGPNNTIFRNFIVAAVVVIEDLMGMGEEGNTPIKIDCKKINKEKFCQLYTIILSYFSFLFSITNKWSKEDAKKALVEVTDRPELVHRILQLLRAHYSRSTGEINMGLLGGKIWDEIVEITEFDKKMDIEQFTYFVTLSGESYTRAIKKIKAELNP
jgi:hypothetical protein